MPGSDLVKEKPSIIFATWFVREIGLMSFSTDLGGICLGRGDTIACFREGGITPSHKEVLYISASSGASSKANSLSAILGMPSGPGAFVQRYCNDTLALIICLTIMVTFFINCDVFNALIRYLPLTTLWSHPWNTVKRRATSWDP